jgi:hypothetical protein
MPSSGSLEEASRARELPLQPIGFYGSQGYDIDDAWPATSLGVHQRQLFPYAADQSSLRHSGRKIRKPSAAAAFCAEHAEPSM